MPRYPFESDGHQAQNLLQGGRYSPSRRFRLRTLRTFSGRWRLDKKDGQKPAHGVDT